MKNSNFIHGNHYFTLGNLSLHSYYQDRMGSKRLPPMEIDYSREIKYYPTWINEFEGNIAGGLIVVFEKDCASIANIAVHPEFQGQGLGGSLYLKHSIENQLPGLLIGTG